MMMAFITSKKNPSVKKVMGIVKIVKIGLTNAFKKAKTTATKMADRNPLTSIPGSNFAVIITATAEINMLAINFTAQKYL